MAYLSKKSGFTLIEVLVAVSLFATVGMLALTVFVNITRIQSQLAMENAIYEDARFMMERISREIRGNAINYEEYYNKAFPANQYGQLYGCYAAQFYNPGVGNFKAPVNLTDVPGTLGAQCNDGTLYTGQECVVFKPSIDLNTGTFPYKGALPAATPTQADSNAFCPKYPAASEATLGATCTPTTTNVKSELYLIDRSGTVETILGRKKVASTPSNQYSLAMVQKTGQDTNNDGVAETWKGCAGNAFCCSGGYDCPALISPGITLTKLEDSLAFDSTGSGIYTGFVPISPLRSNVTRLDFQIIPGEDPRKAFAEPGSVYQPMVRVTLTVQPSPAQLARFNYPTQNDIPTIVLQTTISSRIQSEVKSYLGPDSQNMTGCNLTHS